MSGSLIIEAKIKQLSSFQKEFTAQCNNQLRKVSTLRPKFTVNVILALLKQMEGVWPMK